MFFNLDTLNISHARGVLKITSSILETDIRIGGKFTPPYVYRSASRFNSKIRLGKISDAKGNIIAEIDDSIFLNGSFHPKSRMNQAFFYLFPLGKKDRTVLFASGIHRAYVFDKSFRLVKEINLNRLPFFNNLIKETQLARGEKLRFTQLVDRYFLFSNYDRHFVVSYTDEGFKLLCELELVNSRKKTRINFTTQASRIEDGKFKFYIPREEHSIDCPFHFLKNRLRFLSS